MTARLLSSMVAVVLLSACGSGGSPAGDPDGGTPARPSIQIQRPSNEQVVASRNITVLGIGTLIQSVAAKLNGTALPASAVSFTDKDFSVSVTLGNNRNTVEVLAVHSDGSASSATVVVHYPFATFETFQKASVVIGQADFAGADANRSKVVTALPGDDTVSFPSGRAVRESGKLYLPDQGNSRVLVYDSVPATSGAAAKMVLGQQLFTTNTPGDDAEQWAAPMSVAAGAGRLLVADTTRVLVLNQMPTSSGAAADLAVGWNGIDSPWPGSCAATRFGNVMGVFVADGKLLVADPYNNRVLIWNTVPAQSGISPDLVLGQGALDTCAANAGGSVGDATLSQPMDVWSDGTRVVVADSGNNRVLVWNSFPARNGAPADLVLGQGSFTTTASARTQAGLDGPASLSSNGNQLFVADTNNNRILIWNTFPSSTGALADRVLGQSDFTFWQSNDDNPQAVPPQDLVPEAHPTDRTLSGPAGVAIWDNQLFVTDTGNNRYLIFDGQ